MANSILRLSALACCIFASSLIATAQPAHVQILHNAPDPALVTVDLYINGVLAGDNVAFREATNFLDVPSGAELEIGLAPENSTGVEEALISFARTFEAGEFYFVMVTGVADPSLFAPNPRGKDIGLQLVVRHAARTASPRPDVVNFFFAHGVPDAPPAQIWRPGRGALGGDAPTGFGNATGYGNMLPDQQTLQVRSSREILLTEDVDFSDLAGQAGVLVASGFLDPAANQNGPEFGLLRVMADGNVKNLSEPESPATFQFIHSSPDPSLSTIDITFERISDTEEASKTDKETDDDVSVDDLPYGKGKSRTARSGQYTASISGGTNKTHVASFDVTFEEGKSYSLVLTGLTDQGAFVPNPSADDTDLQLIVNDDKRAVSAEPSAVDVLFVHAVPDAPVLDVVTVTNGKKSILIDDLRFGNAAPYQAIAADVDEVLLTLGQDTSKVIGTFATDLAPYSGSALIAIASGFVNPDDNAGGEPLDLFGILPDDSQWNTSRNVLLNFVHAAPELKGRRLFVFSKKRAETGKIDGPTDDDPSIDDLPYRGGRSQSFSPGFYTFTLVATNDSTSVSSKAAVSDTLTTIELDLSVPQTYSVVVAGVTDPALFVPNPDGADIGLQFLIDEGTDVFAPDASSVSISFVHTITDAPPASLYLVTDGVLQPLAEGIVFGDFVQVTLPADSVNLALLVEGVPNPINFAVDLRAYGGSAFTLPAIGFLDPAANGSDEGAGVSVVGATDEDTPTLVGNERNGISVPSSFRLLGNYPNPFNPATRILFDASIAGEVAVAVYDLAGKMVMSVPASPVVAGAHQSVSIDASSLSSGVYLYRITLVAGQQTHMASGRFVYLR